MTSDIKLPTIFFVGAAKCGTTALAGYLNKHPDVYAVKEPHYFARDLLSDDHRVRQWKNYERHFKSVGPASHIIDASVFYLYSKTAAADLKAFNPDAKILIQLRNPVEVIESHHSQCVFEGGEPIVDFEQALEAEAGRIRGENVPDFPWAKVLQYREFVKFSEQVERFFEVFGRENVQVTIFDDFKKDTEAVYKQTIEFIGADTGFVPEFAVVNPNKQLRSPWAMENLVRNPPGWLSLPARVLFPIRLRRRIKDWVRRKNTKFVKRTPLDPALKKRLTEEMRPEVEKLSKLLGRDLSFWSDGPK